MVPIRVSGQCLSNVFSYSVIFLSICTRALELIISTALQSPGIEARAGRKDNDRGSISVMVPDTGMTLELPYTYITNLCQI